MEACDILQPYADLVGTWGFVWVPCGLGTSLLCFPFFLQRWHGENRLLHRAGCHVGHGRV